MKLNALRSLARSSKWSNLQYLGTLVALEPSTKRAFRCASRAVGCGAGDEFGLAYGRAAAQLVAACMRSSKNFPRALFLVRYQRAS